jgi:hypothetical protein
MQLNNPKLAGVAVSVLVISASADAHVFATSKVMSFSDYANANHIPLKSVKDQFSASGKLVCPAYTGTAQVTGSANILTTSAHLFYDKSCKQVAIERCTFEPLFSHEKYHLVPKGSHIGPCLIETPNTSDDWAVVYIDRPVKGVTPYKIPDFPVSTDLNNNLTVISASARNISNSPFIVKCRARDQGYYPNIDEMDDCSTDSGGSGSAQLVPEPGGWKLVGILNFVTIGNSVAKYDRNKSFTAAKRVNGMFWMTLQSMTKGVDVKSLLDSVTAFSNSGTTQYFGSQHDASSSVAAGVPDAHRSEPVSQSDCNALPAESRMDESLEVSIMGMIIAPITIEACEARKQKTGAIVIAVAPMTPAQSAGFNKGDVIVKWGVEAIATIEDLQKAMSRPAVSGVPVEIVGVNGNGSRQIFLPGAQ